MSKIHLSDIQTSLAAVGWSVISTTYESLTTEMSFRCPEGHTVYSTWRKMREKQYCPICGDNPLRKAEGQVISKKKGVYRILAIDQATYTSGYAVFDDGQLIKYGYFKAASEDETDRYLTIKHWFLSMLDSWQPDFVGLEGIQLQSNGNAHMGVTVFQELARLQGVLMTTCREQKIPFEVCPTNTWRHACGVTGRTRADKKKSMQLIAKQTYDISLSDDEADAVGIGCYLTKHHVNPNSLTNWET